MILKICKKAALFKKIKFVIHQIYIYITYLLGALFTPLLTFPKIIKNRPFGLALVLVFTYNFLSNLDLYLYKPYKFYKANLSPSPATFSLFLFIMILWWFIQVVIIYLLAKQLFKGKGTFKSTLIVLSFCTLPLIILYILNLFLTYNVLSYICYPLWFWHLALVYFGIAYTHKISGWKVVIILFFMWIVQQLIL